MARIRFMDPAECFPSVFVFSLGVLLSLLIVCVARPALGANGNVLAEQKISDITGGFSGVLDDGDHFGAAVVDIGDLDGDAIEDIVVGADRDDDGGLDSGAVWVLFLNSDGSVKNHQKISDSAGGFAGALGAGDKFGSAVGALGDVDGDGVRDLAVAAVGDDDGGANRGAVWVLFLNSDGTVKAHQKISDSNGNFSGALSNDDQFGYSLAGAGDIDGDGVPDLVVGAVGDDDGGANRGAVWVLFLNANGTVKASAKISDATPGFGGLLSDGDGFGSAVDVFRDLDGDGNRDLVVGADLDDDGGVDRGAVWVIFLDVDGSILGSQKISDVVGGFSGIVDDFDGFGSAVTVIRDLDGDGDDEIMVGAPGDDAGGTDRGKVWVLFLDTTGAVTLFRQISDLHGGFAGVLADNDRFGGALGAIRDLDGDGVVDVIVGAHLDDDGGFSRGAAWVLLLDGIPGSLCGDEILDPGEGCDDGNKVNGDCCSASCQFEPAASPCSNGSVCDGDELCDGIGVCQSGTPLNCDDGMPCSQDTCDDILGCQSTTGPAVGCLLAGKIKFEIKDKTKDKADIINWKWRKGEDTLITDFGNPLVSGEYSLCVYDESAGVPSLATPSAIVIPAGAFWQTKGNNGFRYKDAAAAASGVKKIILRAGTGGKAKIALQAKGVNIPMPTAVGPSLFFDQDPSVTVQLLNDAGLCWSSTFAFPAARNDSGGFKDRLP